MSLNKFSDNTIKDYLQIGVNELDCKEIKLNGAPVVASQTGIYNIPVVVNGYNFSITNNECFYLIQNNHIQLNFFCNINVTSLTPQNLQLKLTLPDGKTTKNLNQGVYGFVSANINFSDYLVVNNIYTDAGVNNIINVNMQWRNIGLGNLYVNGNITVLLA